MVFRRSTLGVALVVLAAVLVPSTLSAASLSADMQKAWQRQQGLLKVTVEAMPEEFWGFKPTPEQRTFAEQVLHIAGANSFLMGFVGTEIKGPTVDPTNLSTFGLEATTKAEIVAAHEASFEHGKAALGEFSDESMLEEVSGPPWVGKVTRAAMVQFILGHNMDIYGQLVVYLRLKGVVPPASRR